MPELPAMVFRDLEVTGPFILHTDLDEKWVNFTNVVFDEPVDLSYVHARGIGFYGCELRKGANLSGMQLEGDFVAYKSTFKASSATSAALRLDAAKVEGDVRVLACTVEGNVHAENLRVTGDVDFRGLRMHAQGHQPHPTQLLNLADSAEFSALIDDYPNYFFFKLMGSRIAGSLRLGALYDEDDKGNCSIDRAYQRFPRMTFLGGPVLLANIEISGDLDLRGFVTTSYFSLKSSKIGGSIQAEGRWTDDRVELRGRLVRVRQHFVRSAVAGSMDLYGVQVAGNVELNSAFIAKGLNLIFANISGYVFARQPPDERSSQREPTPPLELGRDSDEVSLSLSGSRCGGIECQGAEMDGLVMAITGEFGRLHFNPRLKNFDPSGIEVRPCRVAGLIFKSVEIKEDALFPGITVEGSTSRVMEQEAGGGDFVMNTCHIAGDVKIGSDGLCRSVLSALPVSEKKRYRQDLKADFNISSERRPVTAGARDTTTEATPAKIDEVCLKSDAKSRTVVGKKIDFSGTKIDRDLNLISLKAGSNIVLDHVTVKGDLLMSARSYAYQDPRVAHLNLFSTECKTLSAKALRCEGDADLSGIAVNSDLKARQMSVRGDLLLATDPHIKHGAGASADIGGNADLQGSSASRFVLSIDNFKHGTGFLDLSDTEFRKITFKGTPPSNPVRFDDASVARWEFIPEITPEELGFIKATKPVLGGAFVSVEKHLRDEGKFREANAVLRAMSHHAWKSTVSSRAAGGGALKSLSKLLTFTSPMMNIVWKPLRPLWLGIEWLFNCFFWGVSKFVGYGTDPWPSLAAIILLLVISTAVFWSPVNLDATKTLREKIFVAKVPDPWQQHLLEINKQALVKQHTASMPAQRNANAGRTAGQRNQLEREYSRTPGEFSDPELSYKEIHPGKDCMQICRGPECSLLCSWNGWSALSVAARSNTPLGQIAVEDFWKPALGFPAAWARVMSYLAWILWPLFGATLLKYILRRL